ncbi:MFS transporter [Hydrogenovibrio sp. 3SP14C1]|uniref:MFS transporter n=1 Tax=Hydrogenovibrio sp. 3SP14C1 TaxID=3038774 RepID=UPI002415F31F|nr:MFS transporter [Hydrogenovibrio sp. 3SP14C1]MDG4811507.1 MFS transporter [Hydrogenovibrio sp. 3SP14C1]
MKQSPAQNQSSLPLSVDVAYGWMGFSLALLGIPLYLYLPSYFFENWGVSLTAVGLALMVTRLLDMLTDPIIGRLSDKFATQGISKVWQMFVGAMILLIGLDALFFPDESLLSQSPMLYITFWSFITFLGWTLVAVPYQALAAEITPDAHEKTRLTLFREGFSILGVVLALSLPFVLSVAPTDPFVFDWIWLLVFFGIILALIAQVLQVKPYVDQRTKSFSPSLKSSVLKKLWRDQRWSFSVMPAYFLNSLGNAFPATLFLLFVSHALLLEEYAGLFLMVYFLSGMLVLPVWFWLSKKIGKYAAWQCSMAFAIIGFIGIFAVSAGDFYGYLIICVLTGMSLGADIALPSSIQADIVQKLSEERDEISGILFGVWGMLTKMALALAVGIALPLLEWLGLKQGDQLAINTLWFFYAVAPILLKVVSFYLVSRERGNCLRTSTLLWALFRHQMVNKKDC